MPGPRPTPLVLPAALRIELDRVSKSTVEPHAHVVRARIALLAAEGLGTDKIAEKTGQNERTVRKWKARFAEAPTTDTLADAPRSGRPAKVSIDTRVAVVRIACDRPDGDDTPKSFRDLWTHQSLADEVQRQIGVRLSKSEVGRILRFQAIRPHVVRQWLHSPDPDFDAKAARICDLYLAPPIGDVVVCVDEKPIQVLARKYPTKVAKDGSLRREFEYVRNGTRALLAAFDVQTGRVIAELVPHRTADVMVEFMQRVAEAYPDRRVHVVWDNLNTHGEGPDLRWTRFNERNGKRFTFVRTPIHASWLNQVECWFSILQRRVIRHGSFVDAAALEERVLGFTQRWNDVEAHPFRWTWRSDSREEPRRKAA